MDRSSRLIYACWAAALALIIALGAIFVAVWDKEPLPLEASAEANELMLEVATLKREWPAGAPIDVSVTFTNFGEKPVIVLPHSCRLEFKGPSARYIPAPMPAVPLWTGARSLESGESMATTFRGLFVWQGGWHLEPGAYEVSAVMLVSNERLRASSWSDNWPGKGPELAGPLWKGEVRAGPIGIVVRKK